MFEQRFRGFLPVVIDVETAGFDSKKDAMLELSAVFLSCDDQGILRMEDQLSFNIKPFEGANLDPKALEFTGIDPYHPFRMAVSEEDALGKLFSRVRREAKDNACKRAILVGHNAFFDLQFLHAAAARCRLKRNPFHQFSSFDTVSLAGLTLGQTVLARAVQKAGLDWDDRKAHSAKYDTERTAALFCHIVNTWQKQQDSSMVPDAWMEQ